MEEEEELPDDDDTDESGLVANFNIIESQGVKQPDPMQATYTVHITLQLLLFVCRD